MQVCFDLKGEPQHPAFAGGDGALAEAALAAVRQFRASPPTVNGAPLLQLSTVAVAFKPAEAGSVNPPKATVQE